MNKSLSGALALAVMLGAAVGLGGCNPQQAAQFQQTAAADAAAINGVNSALIQLNATIIANQIALAKALAQTYCPIVNGAVSLGAAIQANANVAAGVKSKLQAAGTAGAIAEDVCIAVGLGPSTLSPPAAVPVVASSGS